MQRTMGRLAVVSFLVAWVSDSHAADDTVLTWLAAGSKGAACALPSNDPCINAQGLACIFSTCTTARSIADDRCVGSTTNDCNPCVNNVRQQFDDMFATGWWTNGSWHYSDGTRYQPSNLTPGAVYDDGSGDNIFETFWDTLVDFAGIPIHHVQGFVHTNSTALPLAVSHSDDEHGSISLIRGDGFSSFDLDAIHETDVVHPSGMFALGKYVGFTDGGNKLRLLDLNRSRESHRIILDLPKEMVLLPQPPPLVDGFFDCHSEGELVAAGICGVDLPPPPPHSVGTAGGGIAMVRLAGGGHLVVAAEGSRHGGNHFVLLEGNVEQPTRLSYLGFTSYGGPGDFIGSENLSIVTECGTRDIYTVHVGGDDAVDVLGANTAGQGYYRLSKLTWDNVSDKPILTYQTSHVIDQDDGRCWLRGAGTIYSSPYGEEQAFCHARDTESSGPSRFDFAQLTRSVPVIPIDPGGPCGEPPLPTCR